MAGKFSLEAIFKGTDHLSRVIGGVNKRFENLSKAAQPHLKSINSANERVSSSLKTAGVVGAAATVALGAGLMDVISTGAEFEKTMIGAAAKFSPEIRKGTAAFDALRQTAEDVGAKTEFNAQQAASALKDLASAGFSAQQAQAALPRVVDLATASEIDLAAASDMAGKALGAFGLKTDDAAQLGKNLERVTDVMARTADATSASMEGLYETIKEGAPVATAAGVSLETYSAMAGQLANSGIEGTQAGTTLKNTILAMSAPTKEAADAFKKLGVATKTASGELIDPLVTLKALEKATSKMGKADKAGVLEQIFGKIPLAGVLTMLDGGVDKIGALRAELDKAGGSTARMAAIMRDSTKNDIDGFTSAIDGVKIAIFGVISGPLREVLKQTTDWLGANQALIKTKVGDFLVQSIPVIREFGVGLRDGATEVKAFAGGVLSVIGPIESLFGGSSTDRIANAHALGETIVKVTAGFIVFSAVTKAASAATVVFGIVTNGVRAAIWIYEASVKGVRAAIILYEIASKAGVGATVAMSFASKAATVDLLAQRTAAFAAAGGMKALAVTAGAAAAAIGAVMLAKAANDELKAENEGLGMGTLIWESLKGNNYNKTINDHQNKLAKQRAAEKAQKESLGSLGGAAGRESDSVARMLAQLGPLDKMMADAGPATGALAKEMDAMAKAGPGATEGAATVSKILADLQGAAPSAQPGQPGQPQRQVVSQSDRVATRVERSITERKDTLEVTIKDETGNAEVTKKPQRTKVTVTPSGGM